MANSHLQARFPKHGKVFEEDSAIALLKMLADAFQPVYKPIFQGDWEPPAGNDESFWISLANGLHADSHCR